MIDTTTALAIGITWLLLCAAVTHHAFTRPKTEGQEEALRQLRAKAGYMPAWLIALGIAIVLPVAPFLALHGWWLRRNDA